jgi:predicted chitinase
MTTMADNKPINWAYPFKTAGEASKEVSDPQVYFDALAKAKDGFYPMGANGLWHGGVHFDGRTGALLDQSAVRCIADGEVIAYRIDDKYPETPHAATIHPGMGPEPLGAKYSTGFVLVKHRLTLPSTPPPATPAGESSSTDTTAESPPATPAAEAAAASEGLIFYSLYMHLLDWSSYQAASAPKPPAFLAPSQYAVKPTADDPLLGLRVRALLDNGTSTVLALLPKGCTVTLGEAHPLKPQFKQLLSVDEGAAIPALPADTVGWVYAPELTGNTVANKAKDTEQALTLSHQGLNVRQEGKIIGVLPRGAMLKVGEKQSSGYCKVLEVMDYRGVPALPNGPDGKPLGYVFFDELDTQQSEPINRGHVHLLPEPHAIKAGELIGHIGLYQNQGEGTAKPRLHLEVFSCEDVPAFIAKSRALAASLPAEQKTLLKIHKGASKLIPHREDISASNPPKITDTGITIAVELTIPVSVLESLPTERKIQVSETVPGSTTPRITRWWRLDNLLADADGNHISGWLAEQDMITTRHSPWEWEGFDFISETTCNTDQLACHFEAQRLLTEEEKPDYQAQISTADHGPIKARLYDIIDGADGSVRDNILSVEEIKAALSKPWHAQSISRLITHYESEWFWQDAKWDELDKLMEHTEEDPNPQWVKEKARIKKLCWWSELADQQGINEDGKVWHFQPMGFMAFFAIKSSDLITLKMLKKAKPSVAEEYYTSILPYLNKYARIYKIETPLLLAHFLSQVGHESGFKVKSEDLNYSAQRMRKVFGCRNNISGYNESTNECIVLPRLRPKLWSEESTYAHNAENLANYVYASRVGNGDESSGDGYKYRGRGIIQLTGKSNYEKYNRIHNEKNPTDPQNFIEDPDLITSSLDYGIESAFVWWDMNRLNRKIQDSYTLRTESNISDHVADISTIVNGGTVGLAERITLFNNLRAIIKEEHGL